MKIWFSVGDSIDWLESHAAASGVIRVTVELFFAALNDQDKKHSGNIVPCVLTRLSTELASVGHVETLAYLACKTDRAIPSKGLLAPVAPKAGPHEPSSSPQKGDYALFTGVVWSPTYSELFHRLSERGVEFCVFVYDIIPIERPDLVPDEHHRMFVEWLKIVGAKASIIFVSSRITKDYILRWAALVGVDVEARIVPVTFGSTEFGPSASVQELKRNPATARVNLDSFVLSVGTIDRRKNQAFLCKVWCRLIAELGKRRVPQLVLAGRNDLKAGDWDADTAKAMRSGRIVILEGLSNRDLAGLYRACLFTAFPSLSEGYGLPVAESLGQGKLCLASDLSTIKEHAGDLAWYFDTTVETNAYDVIRRAIERPDLRLAAEQCIAARYTRNSWASTFRSIAAEIQVENARQHNDQTAVMFD